MSRFMGTPGPWVVSRADNPKHGASWGGYWQIDAQYDAVACNQFCFAGHGSPDVSEANARLIAAAPDLLEAGEHALNFIENTENEMGERLESGDLLRAAISRALGEGEGA